MLVANSEVLKYVIYFFNKDLQRELCLKCERKATEL